VADEWPTIYVKPDGSLDGDRPLAVAPVWRDGRIISVEIVSAAGPRLVDCEECEAVHPVGECV